MSGRAAPPCGPPAPPGVKDFIPFRHNRGFAVHKALLADDWETRRAVVLVTAAHGYATGVLAAAMKRGILGAGRAGLGGDAVQA